MDNNNLDEYINDPDISKFEIEYLLDLYKKKLQEWIDYGFPPETIEDMKMKILKLQKRYDSFVQLEIN